MITGGDAERRLLFAPAIRDGRSLAYAQAAYNGLRRNGRPVGGRDADQTLDRSKFLTRPAPTSAGRVG